VAEIEIIAPRKVPVPGSQIPVHCIPFSDLDDVDDEGPAPDVEDDPVFSDTVPEIGRSLQPPDMPEGMIAYLFDGGDDLCGRLPGEFVEQFHGFRGPDDSIRHSLKTHHPLHLFGRVGPPLLDILQGLFDVPDILFGQDIVFIRFCLLRQAGNHVVVGLPRMFFQTVETVLDLGAHLDG